MIRKTFVKINAIDSDEIRIEFCIFINTKDVVFDDMTVAGFNPEVLSTIADWNDSLINMNTGGM